MVNNYYGKKIIIIGLGKTGLSCVNFFLSRQIVPFVIDTRINPPNKYKLSSKIIYHYGSWNMEWLIKADLIVVSPGISIFTKELKIAANKGIEIIGDIELFCRENNKPIIAITGSNGKSTVTSLVGEIAKTANLQVGIGGNIGVPILTLLTKKYDIYILELSSFQLETTFSLKPTVATILNITEDHMDRYSNDIKQYLKIKLKIYNNAKICVFNKQEPQTWPLFNYNSYYISFGINNGDYQFNNYHQELQINGNTIIKTNKIKLIGQHNYLNSIIAVALADAINIPRKISLITLTKYIGLPYRYQLVYQNKGIKWINDTKATNINSTKAALNNLIIKNKLYLLLGGESKTTNLMPLKPYILDENIKLCCFGRDGYQFSQLKPNSLLLNTMEECLRNIAPKLKSGDIVLLSPACASFDQFYNFEQRGDKFNELAKKLG